MNKSDRLDETNPGKRSSSTRKETTRNPLQRIVTIHNLLSDNRYPNCSSLSKIIEVTPKTIQRDLDYMRDCLKLPIEYDKGLRGFYYTEDVPFLPFSRFNIKEVRSLKVIRKILSGNPDPELVQDLNSVIEKMISLNGLRDDSPESVEAA